MLRYLANGIGDEEEESKKLELHFNLPTSAMINMGLFQFSG